MKLDRTMLNLPDDVAGSMDIAGSRVQGRVDFRLTDEEC